MEKKKCIGCFMAAILLLVVSCIQVFGALPGTMALEPAYIDKEWEADGIDKGSTTHASELAALGPEEVIEAVAPLFTADMQESGILASVSLAQFLLETGYGKSELSQNANNGFGMKENLSGNSWSGSTWQTGSIYEKKTQEYVGNTNITVVACFRKYDCLEDSIADHSAYLAGAKQGNELRYAGLVGETDYKRAADIIQAGGYATNPSYSSRLCDLIEKYDLTRYDI